MKFLIIIPAHNEEKQINFCLQSLRLQTYANFDVIIVNDGSTDHTALLSKEYETQDSRFRLITLPFSSHQPGAKVVHTFEKGLAEANLENYDIVCKFDADIVFPTDYLAKIARLYQEDPKIGMASGIVKISSENVDMKNAFSFKNVNGEWHFENVSSKRHVRGPIKSYRKLCFQKMGGLRPVLGWDNLDVMLAKMNGFEVKTLPELWVKHLRPTAYQYKNQKAQKRGEYFYNIGLSFPLAVLSSAKAAARDRSFSDFVVTVQSFLAQNNERKLTGEEMQFIRKLRWQEIFSSIKNAIT